MSRKPNRPLRPPLKKKSDAIEILDRDPRILPHDFPEIGATPFTPFRTGPVSW